MGSGKSKTQPKLKDAETQDYPDPTEEEEDSEQQDDTAPVTPAKKAPLPKQDSAEQPPNKTAKSKNTSVAPSQQANPTRVPQSQKSEAAVTVEPGQRKMERKLRTVQSDGQQPQQYDSGPSNNQNKSGTADRKPRSYEMNNYETDVNGDPLTGVRTLSQQLKRKLERAIAENRVIETSMCERAITKLKESEQDLLDLRGQQSDALVHGDREMAEMFDLKMRDVRDTAFRSVHADLLLGDFELKALGIDDKHGRDRWNNQEHDTGGDVSKPKQNDWESGSEQPRRRPVPTGPKPTFGAQDSKPVRKNDRVDQDDTAI